MRARDILSEIEIGGDVSADHLIDLKSEHDFTPKQMTMFGVPAEPTLPNDMKLVGRLGQYYVTMKKEIDNYHKHVSNRNYEDRIFYLFDNGTPVAFVYTADVTKPAGEYSQRVWIEEVKGEGLRVAAVYFDPSVRGIGLANDLYYWLLNHECDYILADLTHSRGGVKLWKSLIRDPRMEAIIWNRDRYDWYPAKPGATWNNIYKDYGNKLVPLLTLKGKAEKLLSNE